MTAADGLRVHIYVQHLLGSGHLVRMKTLAAALARAGHRVTLMSGGAPTDASTNASTETLTDSPTDRPDDGYQRFQLPAVAVAPGDFTALLGADGRPVDASFKARRADQLLRRVVADAPQVLVVETFPGGRRSLRFELVPLLRRVGEMKPRPLTLCSLRDILQLRTHEGRWTRPVR